MRTVEQATREHVRDLEAQQSPVGWDEIVDRGQTETVAMPIRPSRSVWGYLIVAAAVAIVILIGAIPFFLSSIEDPPPATEAPSPPTTVVVPTTVAEVTSDEPIPLPTTDLTGALAGAFEREGRYRVLSLHTSRTELPPLPLWGDSWDIVPDEWGRVPWDWAIHPRAEDLFAVVVPAPETMLEVWTEVWLARFDDEKAATAFVADYAGELSDWASIPSKFPCDGGPCPVDPFWFEVEVSADESFGFTEEGFSTVVGVRQGSIVAIAGIPHHDHPLRPVAGMIEEGRYLAASLVAGISGEAPQVEPPFVRPFTAEESNAIDLIQQFHEALTEGDYERVRSIVWLFSLHRPPFIEGLADDHDPLLQSGAVFEASECRPTTGEGDPVEEVFGVQCLAGYRDGTDHFEYRRFFYDRGKLTEGGDLGY